MPEISMIDVARNGMAYERARLDASSRNIAGANIPVAPGRVATRWRVDPSSFESAARPQMPIGIVEVPVAARLVHDPGSPIADGGGMVMFPDVDIVEETIGMMSSSRAYEANVRSFNFIRSMNIHALEIGSK